MIRKEHCLFAFIHNAYRISPKAVRKSTEDSMNYQDFCEKVKNAAIQIFGEENKTELIDVTKNNGLILKGLVIRHKESDISPTIYLESFYEMYESGIPFGQIMERIVRCEKEYGRSDFDASDFMDFDKIKDRVVYKIVNYGMNAELLKKVPYIRWNDLAILFCCLVDSNSEGYATILIRNEHMKIWGVTPDELYDLAGRNTPRLMSDELNTMENVLSEILRRKNAGQEATYEEESCMYGIPSMYVLTNERGIFGATSMLYSDHLKEVADIHSSGLYILPSSIHEVILLPEDDSCDVEYMKSIIKEINMTELDIEDRLSDNLYYYDRGTDRISIAMQK